MQLISSKLTVAFRRPLVLALMLVAICGTGLLLVVESHSLRSLSDELRSVGLDDYEGPMGEDQVRLVGQISGLYEEEEQLHSREQRLLDQVGRSRPDGAQKGALEVIFNRHLLNMGRLDRLKEELRESMAAKGEAATPEEAQ